MQSRNLKRVRDDTAARRGTSTAEADRARMCGRSGGGRNRIRQAGKAVCGSPRHRCIGRWAKKTLVAVCAPHALAPRRVSGLALPSGGRRASAVSGGCCAVEATGRSGRLADHKGLSDRIDSFEIEQFVALNIYELGGFAAGGRRDAVDNLVNAYRRSDRCRRNRPEAEDQRSQMADGPAALGTVV